MTPKQTRFVQEYLIDLNGTQAAIRAGVPEKSARTMASKWLSKVDIQEAIAHAQRGRAIRTEITQDRVLLELATLGFANAGDYFEWGPDGITVRDKSELTRDQQAAVSEVSETRTENGGTIRVKLYDKTAALEKIARHLGMFNDKLQLGADDSLIEVLRKIDGKSRGLPGN